ncbi:4'-phosphopantetheinyl transferase family protein [Candidatus Nitronereus thalassa]|uniref:4'-phosphopantetheinyl transferase superfamily protein n=1 Tax=Candidatus Nitronereus thalassa TaxID=3020898 RepID=A0ABU3K7Z3_9BACT|nr:4'-phosphopantetheinyl transferase superfamily protein [Candidatus Nitronereus thalassa]MDT7042565.1 4'-phosphopantetheinyl transferase superfamily protein [Candidatus Nitronereus thalassa]
MWRGIVDLPPSRLQVYQESLSREEQERAQRFRFLQHQTRFISTRGVLRSLLGHYLTLAPQEIELDSSPQGKPFVANPGSRPLYFNVSHSQKIALFSFSHDSEVGIDVEGTRPGLDYHSIGQRIMSAQELQWLESLPVSKQKAAFLTCWTRKEAFVKAHGSGLNFPMKDLTLTFLPHQPATIVHIADTDLASRPWAIYPVYPRIRYAAALVVAGRPHTVQFWNADGWK